MIYLKLFEKFHFHEYFLSEISKIKQTVFNNYEYLVTDKSSFNEELKKLPLEFKITYNKYNNFYLKFVYRKITIVIYKLKGNYVSPLYYLVNIFVDYQNYNKNNYSFKFSNLTDMILFFNFIKELLLTSTPQIKHKYYVIDDNEYLSLVKDTYKVSDHFTLKLKKELEKYNFYLKKDKNNSCKIYVTHKFLNDKYTINTISNNRFIFNSKYHYLCLDFDNLIECIKNELKK